MADGTKGVGSRRSRTDSLADQCQRTDCRPTFDRRGSGSGSRSTTNAPTSTASAEIDVEVAQATSTIVCHGSGLEIESAAVDDLRVEWATHADSEQISLELDGTCEPGSHTIQIRYRSKLAEGLVGFYRSRYDNDGEHVLGVTQFQAPYARTAFPCWDEPAFKAVFEVTLEVPEGDLAISNGPEVGRNSLGDGRVEVTFAPTIPMSTYLVAWVIGRLVIGGSTHSGSTPIRVICRPGCEPYTATALEIGAHAIEWFEDYYALPCPSEKMDLVAIPDFAFGAMENLGCVTFREVLLILDPDRLTQPELERAATVIAHEIAHMWFGNLVTMQWWEGIWLNEAFATFMELSCTDAFRPEWSVWTSFGFGRSQAFTVDGTRSTRPIEFEVHTPEEAEAMFDLLTYEKGAAVLRMVEQYVGPERFRDGIRRYLAEHAYGNTATGDLWRTLDETTDAPFSEIMGTWIYQGGHPIVTATCSDASVTLGQKPFAYAGAKDDGARSWLIPVELRGEIDGEPFDRSVLVDAPSVTLELPGAPQWLSVNAGGRRLLPLGLRAGPERGTPRERPAADAARTVSAARRRVGPDARRRF